MMAILLKIIFWSCTLAVAHSYVLYPLLLKLLTTGKTLKLPPFYSDAETPDVIVLMAAYNEIAVIRQKLESLLALDYPTDKITIMIGSDNSTDGTNEMVAAYAEKFPRIQFYPFTDRNGKPRIINRLVDQVCKEIKLSDELMFLMTDASVMLAPLTLKRLVRHLRDPQLALVDTNLQTTGLATEGISYSENQYLSGEVLLKYRESLLWQRMIGPFGGCYLMRSSYYQKVPERFLVDDFYIAMKVFEQGGGAINDLEAHCYESVSDEMSEEYRRKVRIGAGNYQNLQNFRHLLWSPIYPLGFAFFSHKVLRWKGPFFIIFALISSSILAVRGYSFFKVLVILQIIVWIGIPALDIMLRKLGIHIRIFRHLRYFVFMNIALLHGFKNYLHGIQTSIWQPTKRS